MHVCVGGGEGGSLDGAKAEITSSRCRLIRSNRREERRRGKRRGEAEEGRNQSFQSFLMVRFHSQDRWSCLSSSVNLDLTV